MAHGTAHRGARSVPFASESPMSAARMAAEEAFAPPPVRGAPSNEPLVIVRRARALAVAQPSAAETAAPSSPAAAAQGRDKPPRVFRVNKPADPAEAPADEATASLTVRRRRRKPAEQRPGAVVLHVVQPRAASPTAGPTDRQDPGHPDRWPRFVTIEALAAVGPLLDEIARAQAFQFIDERYSLEWERLSRKADRLHQDLKTMCL